MRIRAAATQFGYLLGAVLGGVALAAGGYAALGVTFSVLFVLAALPHALMLLGPRGRRSRASSTTGTAESVGNPQASPPTPPGVPAP
jgi:hypothetical protein